MSQVIERFYAKVAKSDNGCWEWTASKRNGYGQFSLDGRPIGAHRAAWILLRGFIPEGLEIHHKCFNIACVNPEHLELVTPTQNKRLVNPRGNRGGGGHGASGQRGVTWCANISRWRVRVSRGGRQYDIGYFSDLEDAKLAARAALGID